MPPSEAARALGQGREPGRPRTVAGTSVASGRTAGHRCVRPSVCGEQDARRAVVLDASTVAAAPGGLDADIGTTLGLAALTAMQALGGLALSRAAASRHRVARGAVGSLALHLTRLAGPRVVGSG